MNVVVPTGEDGFSRDMLSRGSAMFGIFIRYRIQKNMGFRMGGFDFLKLWY